MREASKFPDFKGVPASIGALAESSEDLFREALAERDWEHIKYAFFLKDRYHEENK